MGAILLIRHGQASFGKADYDKLSRTGERQAVILGESLRHRLKQLDAVYTGTMRRHKQTAEGCLYGMQQQIEPIPMAGWNEYDHEEVIHRYKPAYKNRTLMKADMARTLNPKRAFQKMFSAAIERWMSGDYDDEYAESWLAFEQRCVNALHTLISDLGQSKTALVFTSGGPITAITQHLMNIPHENIFRVNWTLANCGITKIIYSEDNRYLSCLNEHAAFEGKYQDLITYR